MVHGASSVCLTSKWGSRPFSCCHISHGVITSPISQACSSTCQAPCLTCRPVRDQRMGKRSKGLKRRQAKRKLPSGALA